MASNNVAFALRIVADHQHDENINLKKSIEQLQENEDRYAKEIQALKKVIAGYEKTLERSNDTMIQMFDDVNFRTILDIDNIGNAAFAWALEEKLYEIINPNMSALRFCTMLRNLYEQHGEFPNIMDFIRVKEPNFDITGFFDTL